MNKILPLQMEEEPNPQTLSSEILINNEIHHQSTPSNYYQEEEPTVNQLPHLESPRPNKNNETLSVEEETINMNESSVLNQSEVPDERGTEERLMSSNLSGGIRQLYSINQINSGNSNQLLSNSNNMSSNNPVQTTKNQTIINQSHISYSLEQMYKNVINLKGQNAKTKDLQNLAYEYLREMSKIKISKNESFMIRMIFDILKRQSQEEKLNLLIEHSKVKMDEDERIKGFNRLIEDANRRLEAQEQLEILKKKLEDDQVVEKPVKKYKNTQWKEIYNERFMRYKEKKEKKLNKLIKEKQEKERQKEEEEIKLCKTKKAPLKVIEEYGKRLYEESKHKKNKNAKSKKNIKDSASTSNIKHTNINEEQIKENLEIALNEEEDEVRSMPKPVKISNEGVKKEKKGKKKITKIPKLNPSDFIPPGNACVHLEETKADKIVDEFFIKNLHH